MEEKKEYVAPEMKVVDMEYQSMLCASISCPEGEDCDEGQFG